VAPAVSVLICTRDRHASLARTLQSIAADRSTTSAELIVADNASRDETGSVLKDAAKLSPRPLRAITTPVRGHSRVRNEALTHATGDICLFTDDDVTVEPGWIDAIAAAFVDPAVDAAAGRIIPRLDRPAWMANESFFQPLTLWDNGTEPYVMGPGRWPIGANMAMRRALLPRDPFDARFGHTGRAAFGCDETELFDRLFGNRRVVYEPTAVVNHWIDGTIAFRAVRRKMYQHNAGYQRYLNAKGEPLPSYPHRAARIALDVIEVWRAHRHTRKEGLNADTAVIEIQQFDNAAAHVESLFARFPRLSEWVSTKV
jgi:glycosyltransferase involved in cell wall biosynthesis